MRKISEDEYLQCPEMWEVLFVGFNDDGSPWAMVEKKEGY